MSLSQQRQLETRRQRRWVRTRRRDRRGVLLMVVLSLLALFLVLGTAFLVSSKFAADTSTQSSKENRTENNPADLLERAMLQLLRDTNNPNSALLGHSLLRDQYGTDGFVARVLYPASGSTTYMAQYAWAANTGNALGPTNGQLVEIFMMDDGAGSPTIPEAAHIIKLERNQNGFPVDYDPSPASDYYNGCLLTMLEGPAAGQTTRIVDYEYVGLDTSGTYPIYRLRVMVFPRADGTPLNVSGVSGREIELAELVNSDTGVGYAFMVNGRPFNGTGAGYDRLASTGSPRLGASEAMTNASGELLDVLPIALMPNLQYVPMGDDQWESNTSASVLGSPYAGSAFTPFGNRTYGQAMYTSPDGPGGSDESYDAADFQNMFLAHVPLEPSAMASYLNTSLEDNPILDSATALNVFVSSRASGRAPNSGSTVRWNHENTVIPSFHRPALMNYWFNRIANASWLQNELSSTQEIALALADPYDQLGYDGNNGSMGDPVYDQIVAIKRRISMRPLREDHPSFDGSNPQSNTALWELTGPWDVDNDNDGIADSVWVDLGDPVKEAEDGTLYKPLYAFLVIDLDNRLNVNAHGSLDHFAITNFDPLLITTGDTGNLVGGDQYSLGNSSILFTSNLFPVGMGWGPGDISLRSILSPATQPYSSNYTVTYGNPGSDDYARLLMGRTVTDINSDAVWGRMGSIATNSDPTTGAVGPGTYFNTTNLNSMAATREPQLPFDFLGYPVMDRLRAQRLGLTDFAAPNEFLSSPDLRCRYTVGVDYLGQPVNEAAWDSITNPLTMATSQVIVPLVDDSPYETNTTADSRRGLPSGTAGNDDALYGVAEMERLLRAYDAESGLPPSRLYEVVDAFDPLKYVTTIASDFNNPTATELALAQAMTAINRAEVTTDSYEVPVPADVVPSYITELGPDGAPGNAGVDDDGDGTTDSVVPFNAGTQVGEIGWYHIARNPIYLDGWSDDFASLTGKSVADARLVDVLWYRIQRYRIKQYQQDGTTLPYNWNNPDAVVIINNIAKQLLPPEVLAGYKMDINRPFGDGRDNNGNGIVDEPLEAGEPYLDVNGNNQWDSGEPFIDLDGDGEFYADKNRDGNIDTYPTRDLNGDGTIDSSDAEPIVDTLWLETLKTVIFADHTMGIDVTGNGWFYDSNSNGSYDSGEPLVNDDAHLARQLYARHLYVMMLLLSDEEYLAPYDPADPSVRGYLRVKAEELEAEGMDATLAKIEAQRRYTCRQIAQWAVNCVDFRDADACNTPFEYDECPWDGWGVFDTDNGVNYPLDGDVATDENYKQVYDWQTMATNTASDSSLSGIRVIANPTPYATGANRTLVATQNATRNYVWGAERPELLISETAAFHDTRQEDLATSESEGDNTTFDDDDPKRPQDDDPDQRLEPRGSLFVELYNPWSGDAPKPVELYRHGFSQNPNENANEFIKTFDQNGDGNLTEDETYHLADLDGDGTLDTRIEGVLLDRLSDHADKNGRRSPVWRLIVVEEHPDYQLPCTVNTSQKSSTTSDKGSVTRDPSRSKSHLILASQMEDFQNVRLAAGNESTEIPFIAPTNFDWDEMFYRVPYSGSNTVRWPMSQWQQQMTDTENNVKANDPQDNPSKFDRELFAKPYPYIQQEIYFTSGNTPWGRYEAFDRGLSDNKLLNRRPGASQRTYSDLDLANALPQRYDELKVRIPFNFIRLPHANNSNASMDLVSLAFRFVSSVPVSIDTDRPDVGIAPVLPGRYAIIGSAGTTYTRAVEETNDNETTNAKKPRFITTIGRNVVSSATTPKAFTDDAQHLQQLETTRRIELRPSTNPFTQQFAVGANGGLFNANPTALQRFNEYISLANGSLTNMTGSYANNYLDAESNVVAPVVVVPVDDMNISEPAYGYGVRARELIKLQGDLGDQPTAFDSTKANGEGEFVNAAGDSAHFDATFDADPEFQGADKSPQTFQKYRVVHLQRLADPTMPWNPPAPGYNFQDPVKQRFMANDPSLPVNPYLTVDSSAVDLTVFNGTSSYNANLKQQNKLYRSTERGYTSYRSLRVAAFARKQRNIWVQDSFLAPDKLLDDETKELYSTQRDGMPTDLRTSFGVKENHYDYILHHSLGVMNQSFGDMYLRPGITSETYATDPTDPNYVDRIDDGNEATMGAALGAPRPNDAILNMTSTFPWLAWNNRPFVSESELLQVPAWSNAELLRKVSSASGQDNLFDGSQINSGTLDAEATNKVRYKAMTGNFGHLLNMYQSSDKAAYIDTSTGEPIPVGAPNFHRILDYVHTPSRFVATDTLLDPQAFSLLGTNVGNNSDDILSPDDPRASLAAPFNRVANYREPGKVNLNTMKGQRAITQTSFATGISGTTTTLLQSWSDVYDGLMHRVHDIDPNQFISTAPYGHFGPAWRDIVRSRRGYADPLFGDSTTTGPDRAELVMNSAYPTFFAKPFRSSEAGDLVPIASLKDGGIEVSMLRPHPIRPSSQLAWGGNNGNGLANESREAIYGSASDGTPVPLFSELCSTAAIDGQRNSAMYSLPLTRLDNLTTTRSGVFGVWVTVGYFEVLPAPDWNDASTNVATKFTNQAGGDADRGRALYNKVYPQGYQLGKELGSDTGDLDRHKAFYIIDRTRPVAFKPGEDVNVEKAILLRRRID